MTWQLFLTVYLSLVFTVSISTLPKRMKVMGKTDAQISGGLIGTTLKYILIFSCLHYGGYYE